MRQRHLRQRYLGFGTPLLHAVSRPRMHHLVLSCAKDVMPNKSAVAVHHLHVADRWACGGGLAARDSAVALREFPGGLAEVVRSQHPQVLH